MTRVGERLLRAEGNKTESVYRWLRVGKPKSVHLIAVSLSVSYGAVNAIISDLRRLGAVIRSQKIRGETRYKMLNGPFDYAGLKRKARR